MSSVRLRRLQADHAKLLEYVKQQPRIQIIQTDGDPPELYQLRYQVVGLRQKEEGMRTVKDHLVEITLPLNYPRLPPQCRMLTPVFHPNIAPHAICIGDHWSSGESLTSIVARIGEMLSYQSYNTKSPLNGEAARWVDENMDSLPLDSVSFIPNDAPVAPLPAPKTPPPPPESANETDILQVMPVEPVGGPADDLDAPIPVEPVEPASRRSTEPPRRPPTRQAAAGSPTNQEAPPVVEAAPEVVRLNCPMCGVRLKVRPSLLGKTVRCPGCQNAVSLPRLVDE